MDNHPKVSGFAVVAVVIAVIALGISIFGGGAPASIPGIGGERAGLQEFVDGIKAGALTEKTLSVKMPAGANSVAIWHNTTGKDATATFGSASVPTGSTASSSALVSLIATTSPSIGAWADFGNLNARSNALLERVRIATSTTASTTNSVRAAVQGQGNGSVLVPNGSYLFGFLQQDNDLASPTGCYSVIPLQCEAATSTNRGYNPVFNVKVHY